MWGRTQDQKSSEEITVERKSQSPPAHSCDSEAERAAAAIVAWHVPLAGT